MASNKSKTLTGLVIATSGTIIAASSATALVVNAKDKESQNKSILEKLKELISKASQLIESNKDNQNIKGASNALQNSIENAQAYINNDIKNDEAAKSTLEDLDKNIKAFEASLNTSINESLALQTEIKQLVDNITNIVKDMSKNANYSEIISNLSDAVLTVPQLSLNQPISELNNIKNSLLDAITKANADKTEKDKLIQQAIDEYNEKVKVASNFINKLKETDNDPLYWQPDNDLENIQGLAYRLENIINNETEEATNLNTSIEIINKISGNLQDTIANSNFDWIQAKDEKAKLAGDIIQLRKEFADLMEQYKDNPNYAEPKKLFTDAMNSTESINGTTPMQELQNKLNQIPSDLNKAKEIVSQITDNVGAINITIDALETFKNNLKNANQNNLYDAGITYLENQISSFREMLTKETTLDKIKALATTVSNELVNANAWKDNVDLINPKLTEANNLLNKTYDPAFQRDVEILRNAYNDALNSIKSNNPDNIATQKNNLTTIIDNFINNLNAFNDDKKQTIDEYNVVKRNLNNLKSSAEINKAKNEPEFTALINKLEETLNKLPDLGENNNRDEIMDKYDLAEETLTECLAKSHELIDEYNDKKAELAQLITQANDVYNEHKDNSKLSLYSNNLNNAISQAETNKNPSYQQISTYLADIKAKMTDLENKAALLTKEDKTEVEKNETEIIETNNFAMDPLLLVGKLNQNDIYNQAMQSVEALNRELKQYEDNNEPEKVQETIQKINDKLENAWAQVGLEFFGNWGYYSNRLATPTINNNSDGTYTWSSDIWEKYTTQKYPFAVQVSSVWIYDNYKTFFDGVNEINEAWNWKDPKIQEAYQQQNADISNPKLSEALFDYLYEYFEKAKKDFLYQMPEIHDKYCVYLQGLIIKNNSNIQKLQEWVNQQESQTPNNSEALEKAKTLLEKINSEKWSEFTIQKTNSQTIQNDYDELKKFIDETIKPVDNSISAE
ncbi:hypothetical protein [Mycoplasmopsis felifaucium]|uniref:hypothetical protein n=1 Tax=Mycoplasmopsis felifaucium TaxID=35768 RepID=UPI0004830061|nr:hypothetical protein [Mycoplasmopsis felifaucium]